MVPCEHAECYVHGLLEEDAHEQVVVVAVAEEGFAVVAAVTAAVAGVDDDAFSVPGVGLFLDSYKSPGGKVDYPDLANFPTLVLNLLWNFLGTNYLEDGLGDVLA